MKARYYKNIITTFLFVAVLGVPVGNTLAADSINISNSASASSDTGGKSSNGADGNDGADGRDGQDGKDGADGQNVVSGNSSASSHIKTTIDGEDVVNIEKRETAAGSASTSVTSKANATSSDTVSFGGELLKEVHVASSSLLEIRRVLSSIRELLLSYAAKLF